MELYGTGMRHASSARVNRWAYVAYLRLFAVNAYRIGSQPTRLTTAISNSIAVQHFAAQQDATVSPQYQYLRRPSRSALDLSYSEWLHQSSPPNLCPLTHRTSHSPSCWRSPTLFR